MAKYDRTDWTGGDLITENLLDRIEEQLEIVTPGATNIAADYKADQQYARGAYCFYDGDLWRCVETCTNTTPAEGRYWHKTTITEDNNQGISNNIAPEFVTQTVYNVGDYVVYNTDLYRCISNITQEENVSWANIKNKWEKVILSTDTQNLIVAQNTQPTLSNVKIWIQPNTEGEYEIPLNSEFQTLKDYIMGSNDIVINDLSSYELHGGYLSGTKTWNNINTYQHKYVPVIKTNGILTITASADQAAVIGFVRSYSTPLQGGAVDYCTEEGFNDRIVINKGATITYKLPENCSGIVVISIQVGVRDLSPTFFELSFPGNKSLMTRDEINKLIQGDSYYNRSSVSDLIQHTGNLSTSNAIWNNIDKPKYKYVIMPVVGNMKYEYEANSERLIFGVLKDYIEPKKNEDPVYYSKEDGWKSVIQKNAGAKNSGILPKDAKYIALMVKYNDVDCTPTTFKVTAQEAPTIKWLALGDSITQGNYSVINEGVEDSENHLSETDCYAAVCAQCKGFDLTNKGIGGSGWVKRGTAAAEKPNSRDLINSGSLNFSNYDLLTIMWGVNDWKGGVNLGQFEDGINPEIESVYGNMRYFIETAQQSNPKMKIIIISPVNCRHDTSVNPSTAENNWGIGYKVNGYTLEDYNNAMQEVCDYYGIQYVDMLHGSIINRLNAATMLPDKVHPSLDAHRQLGVELAGKMQYYN